MPGWQHEDDLLARVSGDSGIIVAVPAIITVTANPATVTGGAAVTGAVASIAIDGVPAGSVTIQAVTATIAISTPAALPAGSILAATASIAIAAKQAAVTGPGDAVILAAAAQITILGIPADASIGTTSQDYDQASGYDLPIGWDGTSVISPPPPPPPPPPTFITLLTNPPFGQTQVYILETRTKTGRRVAQLPYFNIQMEDMLNDAGALRCDLPVFHPNVSRLTVEEGIHELWLWRKGVLIFAGPLWQITGNASEKVLHLTANGLLSYFNFRRIDQTLRYLATDNGPSIAGKLIDWTQSKPFGNLGIKNVAINGPTLGYKVTYNWFERTNLLTAITDLANNVVTGFDFSIDPQTREFRTYAPRRGNKIPGVLEYNANITDYSLPRAASTVVNDDSGLGPGDGEAMITGNAVDTNSLEKYGLMQGEVDAKNVKTKAQAAAQARKDLSLRKAPSTVPTLTMRGRDLPFIGSFSPGDQTHIRIDNGYDQFNRVLRMTGYQLTVGTNDEESVNVYIEGADAAV